MRRAFPPTAARESARWVALAWLPMLVWFAAFRPGLMSSDSLVVWGQATEGGWVDLHSPLYTAAMWLSHIVVGSPSLLTLAQSLLLAASVVAVGRALVRAGVARTVVLAACGLTVCTPMVGAFSVSLWKDVPFTAALLFVLARLVDVVQARAAGSDDDAQHALRSIIGWVVLAVLLRQNGVLVATALLVLLAVVMPPLRRGLLKGVLVSVAVLVVARFVVYPVLGVEGAPANSEVSTFLHDIASVAGRDAAAFDPADRALLESIAPFEEWAAGWRSFSCASANWQFREVFRWERIEGRQSDFVALWGELLLENPRAVIGNRSCAGAVAWRPDSVGVLYTVSRGVDTNGFGLATVPIVDRLHAIGIDVLEELDGRVQPLVWRAPGWLYLAYAAVGVAAWRRRQPLLLVPLAMPLALQASVAVLNPAQDARYLMPGLMAAWLLLPLATADLGGQTDPAGPAVSRLRPDRSERP